MKKNKKIFLSNQSAKKRLCQFGLELKPSCGMYFMKYSLEKNPDLRARLASGEFPPYCYSLEDDDTVIMDYCLVCFLKKGLSAEAYERINCLMGGITRDNHEEKLAIAEFYAPEAAKKIKAEREELIQEMIKDGIPVDLGLRNLHDC